MSPIDIDARTAYRRESMRQNITVGGIIQANDRAERRFRRALGIVTEKGAYGVIAAILIPGERETETVLQRFAWDQIEYAGEAALMPKAEARGKSDAD